MSNGPLQDDWFSQAPVPSDRPGGLPSMRPSAMPPARVAGDPMWSSLSGAVGGALGVGSALLGGALLHAPVAAHPRASWIVLGILGGVALGAAFGRITRRLTRVLPRVIFGVVASVSLCLVLYAFVLVRVAPELDRRSIPFQTSALGALLYGACLGAMPLLRTRSERGRKL